MPLPAMIRTLVPSTAAKGAEQSTRSGARELFCVRSSSRQTGDSSRAPKINTQNTELRMPAKNMTRQPQVSKAFPVNIDEVTKKAVEAKNAPSPTPPPLINPDMSPRHRGGTDSVPIVCVEATTPPTNTP